MTDKQFYDEVEKVLDMLMPGVANLVVDIAKINDVYTELHKRQKEVIE